MIEGELLEVFRGDTDKYGNPNKTPHGTVRGSFAWGKFTRDRERRESKGMVAELYTARGVDLKPRDRIRRANGEAYAVIGGMWDQDHPFDGFDFGMMVWQVEAM